MWFVCGMGDTVAGGQPLWQRSSPISSRRGDRDEADAAREGLRLREGRLPVGVPRRGRSLVVQGLLLDSATESNLLNMLPGEGAVHIDAKIVRAALANLM